MKKSRFTDRQISEALKRVEAELAVPEICRELGVSTAKFYNWRAKYGDMDTSMMARLKNMYAEERLTAEILNGGYNKKLMGTSRRREMAKRAVAERGISIRQACLIFSVSQTCYRYEAKKNVENDQIVDWLLRLTDNHRNWSFGLCYLYLRNDWYFKWSHKRIDLKPQISA